jgi:DNA-binding CsgD family transcriptional regulator
MRRNFLKTVTSLAALAMLPLGATADTWPSKSIEFVVGYAAGGPTDVTARVLAELTGPLAVLLNAGIPITKSLRILEGQMAKGPMKRIAAQLDGTGRYADERVMKRLSGGTRSGRQADATGELFWCHVSGRALNPRDPHASGIWVFEDLSSKRVLSVELTPREREVAALLIQGLTSKLVGRRLDISPRTVDVYRARLMRKTGAATTTELVHKLLQGQA